MGVCRYRSLVHHAGVRQGEFHCMVVHRMQAAHTVRPRVVTAWRLRKLRCALNVGPDSNCRPYKGVTLRLRARAKLTRPRVGHAGAAGRHPLVRGVTQARVSGDVARSAASRRGGT